MLGPQQQQSTPAAGTSRKNHTNERGWLNTSLHAVLTSIVQPMAHFQYYLLSRVCLIYSEVVSQLSGDVKGGFEFFNCVI
jgi:hypothetical protein